MKNRTPQQILEDFSFHCETLRTQVVQARAELVELSRRLEQIVQQLHKNIEVRDTSFADEFNGFCQRVRQALDAQEPVWQELRAQARAYKSSDWSSEWTLLSKEGNMRAKALSRVCDEFMTAYNVFSRIYKNFTAAKLNVWLLTSCQNDLESLTGKILFLAREIAQQTEGNRGKDVIG